MPANLPPQYYDLEREYRSTRDPQEKLRIAEELLRIMPKHKGTDKLQAEMKVRISKLKKLLHGPQKTHGARHVSPHDYIEREGAGQVVFVGAPNSGKSSLVDAFTNAEPLIGDYPYTTREPLTGMMTFETIQIQLIDTPPISDQMFENYMQNLVRNADLAVLVCDLAVDRGLVDAEFVINALEEKKIILAGSDAEPSEDFRIAVMPTLVCGHKVYDDESGERLKRLENRFVGYSLVPTSILEDESLERLQRAVFDALRIIRIYTKQVGKKVELVDPVVLPVGGTVEQAAEAIHKDFAQNLKFAKLWGHGKFEGQRVNRDHVLVDGDVVEFHI
jgi:small GTP-binding protein